MCLEKTLELYSLLRDSPPSLNKLEALESLSESQTPKYLYKTLSKPDPLLQEKMSEYKSRLKSKISYSLILESLIDFENTSEKLEKSQNLLNSFKTLSPDLNLAKIQLASIKHQ